MVWCPENLLILDRIFRNCEYGMRPCILDKEDVFSHHPDISCQSIFNFHSQTIVGMRDRHKLEEYREHVKFDAKYRQKIVNLLSESSVSMDSTL